MKQLRTLAVTFDSQLPPWELPKFRGAFARKVGLENEWFHNHNNETGGYHNRYPLIQYKVNARDGGYQPMLLCIEQGVEEAHHFFSKPEWDMQVGDKHHDMRIAHLNVEKYTLNVWEDQTFRYRLHNWQALNTENYLEYKDLNSLSKRIAFLDKVLASNILSFARGVDWEVPRHFDIQIDHVISEKWVPYKGVKVLAFSVEFTGNISLPEWIGLGKGGSTGWGVVRLQGGRNALYKHSMQNAAESLKDAGLSFLCNEASKK
jgi:Cas6b C-terminal domain/Cas6b N-terminal domain